jgi:serine/threonine protein phosphatase 1
MTGPPTIARLSRSGRIWAIGALLGNDTALEALARAVLSRWRPGDRLVVLGNMLGPNGDPARVLNGLLLLRRRLMAANRGGGVLFLRGGQEEMWQKALSLQFAMTPLEVLDWMLERGLAAIIQAYGANTTDGRIACRNGPTEIARWTRSLRQQQAAHPGHAEVLNSLKRAALGADGALLLSAAGVDATRPLDEQGDAFWWNAQSDTTLAAALSGGAAAGWNAGTRLVRGAGPSADAAADDGPVVTVMRSRPAVVALDSAGAVLSGSKPRAFSRKRES